MCFRFSPIALLFLIGPVCGYIGARSLDKRKIQIYLNFCVLKSFYVLILFCVCARGALYLLVLAVQLWVTQIVYKFWKLLRPVTAERAAQLIDPAYTTRARLVLI